MNNDELTIKYMNNTGMIMIPLTSDLVTDPYCNMAHVDPPAFPDPQACSVHVLDPDVHTWRDWALSRDASPVLATPVLLVLCY